MQHARVITQFVVEEFLPDMSPGDVDVDLDLIDNGIIDSLGLLKVIAWLEDRFGIAADDLELSPEQFRSIRSIDTFVALTATHSVEAS
ncbi:acyl carrier protein [Micromonospora arborensis]|uniref:Acyl carrier protein n=1 Tax=Micromonospora arborensis TaxID=2116518 RepID=A0A318NFV8_9ACTN|nr:phosphopantetheine-binding protein [Micromonospora arborensis]PYC64813.1 acyl carrier protein [Micromonospora arborensis]